MGKILSPLLVDFSERNLKATDVDYLFRWYGKRKDNASIEGLGKIASNIAVSFSDFVGKIRNNIKASNSQFKEFKRSDLRIIMDSNAHGMRRVFELGYSQLNNSICPIFPFTGTPKEAALFFNDIFTTLSMKSRMEEMTDHYFHLAAAIRVNNVELASTLLDKIDALNLKTLNTKIVLTNMVLAPTGNNKTSFGSIFDSVGDFKETITLTLVSENELNNAIVTSKQLDLLYRAFEKINEAIIHASSINFDLSGISGIAGCVFSSGELIEDYAMLVKEYTHLDHFLTLVSDACLTIAKK